jgi:hypothetical protein
VTATVPPDRPNVPLVTESEVVPGPITLSSPWFSAKVPPFSRNVPVDSVDVPEMLMLPALSVVRPVIESVLLAALRASVATAFPTVRAP